MKHKMGLLTMLMIPCLRSTVRDQPVEYGEQYLLLLMHRKDMS